MRILAVVAVLLAAPFAGCLSSADGQGPLGALGPHAVAQDVLEDVPATISVNVTLCLCAHLAVDWDRVAALLPKGFTPAGHPNVPVMDAWWGTPEGTFADAMVAVFTYDDATVDGTSLPGGKAAMLWVAGHPPPELYMPPPEAIPDAAGYVWVGLVATDPALVAAFTGLGVPAVLGEVLIGPTGPGPYAHARGAVAGGDLDFMIDVAQPTIAPTGPGGQFERIVEYAAEGDVVQQVMYHHIGRHNALVGPALVQGSMGGLGAGLALGGFAQILWFGDGATVPAGVPGLFRFDVVSLE